MMRIMLSLMAGKHLFSPSSLSYLANLSLFILYNKLLIKHMIKQQSLVCEGLRKCSFGFTWHLLLRKISTYFVTRIANLVLLYGLRDF